MNVHGAVFGRETCQVGHRIATVMHAGLSDLPTVRVRDIGTVLVSTPSAEPDISNFTYEARCPERLVDIR